MKKYRVTEKHSFYKAGVEFTKKNDKEIRFTNNGWVTHESWTRINVWLHDGWIKEIQQPLFTEDDMRKAFWSGHNTSLTFDEYINE